MNLNYSKIAKAILILSIPMIIIGYFLWTILIPLQDINLMTQVELLSAQKELALNYPLGRFLLYLGFLGLISSSVYLIIITIQKRKAYKKINKHNS